MEFTISIFIGGVLKGKKTLQTPCLIGRSKEAGLTVAHPSMSRKHCELYEDGGVLYLRDNSSLNGTLFDGEYIEDPIPLEFGDEFTVGELAFRITAPEASLAPEQRRQLAEQPTEAIELDRETIDLEKRSEDGASEKPGLATVIETPGIPKLETPPPEKKSKKPKIAPTDVRIDLK